MLLSPCAQDRFTCPARKIDLLAGEGHHVRVQDEAHPFESRE
jgi:hypothetical protein